MRSVRRLLTLAVAASGLLVSSASLAAAAEPYPLPPPAVTVNQATIIEGQNVIVTGINFGPTETVNINATRTGDAVGRLGRSAHALAAPTATTTVADNTGTFHVTLTPPRGRWIIAATGQTTGRTGSVAVVVLPPGSQLPNTGNDGSYLGIILVGSAVVLTGIALLVVARTRRRPKIQP